MVLSHIDSIVFDFDQVLYSSGDIHFKALNKAISTIDPKYQISEEDDKKFYGTIPSKEKLKKLSEKTDLPLETHSKILDLKKKFTNDLIDELDLDIQENVIECVKKLHTNYKLIIASNTNKDFIEKILNKQNLLSYFSKIYSNSDISKPKPNPEMYLKICVDFNTEPRNILILEDSATGQEAAIRSGANLYPIENPNDVIYENIVNHISTLKQKIIKWKSNKINVLMLAAGKGQRFVDQGFTDKPKPLINVNGIPMIGLVCEKLNIEANFIFVVKEEHCEKFQLETTLNLLQPNCKIVKVSGQQYGSAYSALQAKELIDNENHLMIVNSDQIWEWQANNFYYQMIQKDVDGGILTIEENSGDTKWSYAKIDENNNVAEVAEKKPISNIATVGIYWFNKGSDFVKYSEQMIQANDRVNNEFYTCPVYNYLIKDGKTVKYFHCDKFIDLGTPENLKKYLESQK
jgi:HAD superfamily hydrolase (TIGR01509 family)